MSTEATPSFVDAFERIRIYLVTLENWSFSGDVCRFDFTLLDKDGSTESFVSLTLSGVGDYSFRVRGEKEESTDILDLILTRMDASQSNERSNGVSTDRESTYEFFLISSYIVVTVVFTTLDIGAVRPVVQPGSCSMRLSSGMPNQW